MEEGHRKIIVSIREKVTCQLKWRMFVAASGGGAAAHRALRRRLQPPVCDFCRP